MPVGTPELARPAGTVRAVPRPTWPLDEFAASLTSAAPATVVAYRATSPRSSSGPSVWASTARRRSTAPLLRRYLAYLATRRLRPAHASPARPRRCGATSAGCARTGRHRRRPVRRPVGAPGRRPAAPGAARRRAHALLDDPPAARRRPTTRAPCAAATTPCSSCSTAAACGWPSCAASTRPTSTSADGGSRCGARASKQRRVPLQRAGGRRPRAVARRRPRAAARPPSSPRRRACSSTGGAGRLDPRDVRRILDRRSPSPDPPPRPAPHLRHPPARRRCRPAGRAGAARPRRPGDDAASTLT